MQTAGTHASRVGHCARLGVSAFRRHLPRRRQGTECAESCRFLSASVQVRQLNRVMSSMRKLGIKEKVAGACHKEFRPCTSILNEAMMCCMSLHSSSMHATARRQLSWFTLTDLSNFSTTNNADCHWPIWQQPVGLQGGRLWAEQGVEPPCDAPQHLVLRVRL